ncbi:MAG: BLUF domain-containing protein [Alphaproteobacteria bacterium]
MQLSRLIYASERVVDEKLDLMSLLQSCVDNNRKRAITGILWYDGRHFIQCLEGSRMAISALYSHIAIDPRHKNVHLINFGDIERREFEQWAMGLAYDGGESHNTTKYLRYSPTEKIDPSTMSAKGVLELLKESRDDL